MSEIFDVLNNNDAEWKQLDQKTDLHEEEIATSNSSETATLAKLLNFVNYIKKLYNNKQFHINTTNFSCPSILWTGSDWKAISAYKSSVLQTNSEILLVKNWTTDDKLNIDPMTSPLMRL